MAYYRMPNLESAIDLMAYLYPNQISDYIFIAHKIRTITNLGTIKAKDIRNYYESDYYQSQGLDVSPKTKII